MESAHRRGERGQVAVSYAGALAVVAIVFGALFVLGLDGKVGQTVNQAICTIFSGTDCGEPQANASGYADDPYEDSGDAIREIYDAHCTDDRGDDPARENGDDPAGSEQVDEAYANLGRVYDYYLDTFGHDSYDGGGAPVVGTVNFCDVAGVPGGSSFWDGDEVNFAPGAGDALDTAAHEFTHGVIDHTADLDYECQSGALNESIADMIAWNLDPEDTTYGEDRDSGPIRDYRDPSLHGQPGHVDDYVASPNTDDGDYGGVHTNSGIANLAFSLMVTGGTHPRAKTTVSVPALSATATTSMDMGGKIWYRALTVYMNSSTNFLGARAATAQAATDLYGAAAANTVQLAWDAVGVPRPAATVTLTNGVAVTGLSASTGSWKHFVIAVPSGQSKLDIVQSGGTGDADLYVKVGSQPTSSSYSYRPYLTGNAESVSVTNPAAGNWYISIYAYASYSSLSIKATYTGGTTTPGCTSVSSSLSGTGANYYSTQYTSSLSGAHTAKLTGPASGADFDLYLQKLSGTTWSSVAAGETATATENVSYNGTAGTYRWRVYAYSGSGAFTLCTSHP